MPCYQLRHSRKLFFLLKWLRVKDSNLRPLGYEPNSLTTDVTRDIGLHTTYPIVHRV